MSTSHQKLPIGLDHANNEKKHRVGIRNNSQKILKKDELKNSFKQEPLHF